MLDEGRISLPKIGSAAPFDFCLPGVPILPNIFVLLLLLKLINSN